MVLRSELMDRFTSRGIYGTDKKQLDGSFQFILCGKTLLYLLSAQSWEVQYKCSARLFEFLNIGKKQNIGGGARSGKLARAGALKVLDI